MIKKILKHKDILSLFAILLSIVLFFYPFLLYGKLPIPADTIIGLYNPYRDLYAKDYPNGIPYKNFLITDPVRQQYVWKDLAIDMLRQGQLPIWNVYEMSGKPLLANFQSGVFYPLNIILFINPFSISWSVFIFLQLLLAGIFMYFYLKSLKISHLASIFGTICWVFSGFFVSWLEWGNIVHTALWLPLILLSVQELLLAGSKKREIIWFFVFLFSLCSSFFAGHLQSFFYISIFTFLYTLCFWIARSRSLRKIFPVFTAGVLFITITSIQWAPTLQYIDLSGRAHDQYFTNPGWFIPYQNLAQFVAPDFLGNPTTLNYFGVFNYGEFIGYIGIGGLLFAITAFIFRRDKKTVFYAFVVVLSLFFALKNPVSLLPFILKIPFISTAQPSRLLLLICFSLAVLSALGFDVFIKKRSKKIGFSFILLGAILMGLWGVTYFMNGLYPATADTLVSQSNLRLPTILFICLLLLSSLYVFIKNRKIRLALLLIILILSIFDLLRFSWKYTPFTNSEYLFPETKTISFLKNDNSLFRIAATDSRLLPPNFATIYKIQSIEGYDPLYLKNYAKLIASNERSNNSIQEPFGFNRIITPRNLDSNIADFLNVKYVLSLNELSNPKYKKVLEEGTTKIYENINVIPRFNFVTNVISTSSEEKAAKLLPKLNLATTAIVINGESKNYSKGGITNMQYKPERISFTTTNSGDGFLVISDTYYPSFRATIDGEDVKIIPTNIAFRGIKIPKGTHDVVIRSGLF